MTFVNLLVEFINKKKEEMSFPLEDFSRISWKYHIIRVSCNNRGVFLGRSCKSLLLMYIYTRSFVRFDVN